MYLLVKTHSLYQHLDDLKSWPAWNIRSRLKSYTHVLLSEDEEDIIAKIKGDQTINWNEDESRA